MNEEKNNATQTDTNTTEKHHNLQNTVPNKTRQRPSQPRTITAAQRRKRTLWLVQLSLLIVIEAFFCFTPLGSLPAIGPIVMTLAMIPVIIAGILLGPGTGSILGFIAGLFSCIVWTFMPPNPATAFVFTPFYSLGDLQGNFWSLVICFVPRVLTGTVAGLISKGFTVFFANKEKKASPDNPYKPTKWANIINFSVSAAVGSMINTLLVLGGIYLFFGQPYAAAVDSPYSLLLLLIGGTILSNGIPEAVLAAICAPAICIPVKKMLGRKKVED